MKFLRAFFVLTPLLLSGCASTHANNPVDPLESLNRGVYKFNDTLDKAVAKPLAKGYKKVVPQFGRTMVSNFFSNLDDVVVTLNDFLQFKLAQGVSDTTRFLVNSTIGVLGFFDVASTGNLNKHNEDFGQTLGKWGVGNGPYLVLPIFGPSTLRDGVGLYTDSQVSLIHDIKHIPTRNEVYAAQAIDQRAALLDQENILDEAAIDPYTFIRDAYLLHRNSLVYDGNPPREKLDDPDSPEPEPAPSGPAKPRGKTTPDSSASSGITVPSEAVVSSFDQPANGQ
ncbi:MAG TPA: VacJ family lipoprotein [Gallionella sp.]|nr:VacJ family lipoprotein [Gallionella sp.]